jgi:hypothetical protein
MPPSTNRLPIMSYRLLISAASLAALLAAPAYGAELGDTRVLSHVGQPLNAEIELTGISAAEAGRLAVRPASADLYLQANIKPDPALASLKFEVEQRGGQIVVHATSGRPVTAPYLHVFVEVPAGAGYAVRALTFWLPPAPPGAVVAQAEPQKARPRPAKPKAVLAADTPAGADAPKAAEPAPGAAVRSPAVAGRAGAAASALASAAAMAHAAPAANAAAVAHAVPSASAAAVAHAAPAAGVAASPSVAAHATSAASTAHAAPALAATLAAAHGAAPLPASAQWGAPGPHAAKPALIKTAAAAEAPAANGQSVSTHLPPSGPGVISTRPDAAHGHAAAGAISPRAPAPEHAAAAAMPAPAGHAQACPAPKQLRAELAQCAAIKAENDSINMQIEVLEQKVDTLRHAVVVPAPLKPLKVKNTQNAWIWNFGVPGAIAAFAMAGAAWFAGRSQGRRAGDKRAGKRKAREEAEAPEAADDAEVADEHEAVQGMIAKARAALRKMRSRKAKAADAALPEPEPATQEG